MAMNVFFNLSSDSSFFFLTQLVVWAATKLPIVENVSFAHPIAKHSRKVLQSVIVKRDMPDCRMTHRN